eukprot:TRINITY_DN4989_c0_g1_i5.p1 TRINITY_DN4989_c0_g1~~TRINITY_DN4989_c0_g1_i5.p1  ORF type:complete len:788 (-),score=334.16 TRINITY_DN4989_c0_g1_i5:122-2455(-)
MGAQHGIDVRAELLKFHATYYSANRMSLVVLGREPLDVLQRWAVEKFSSVRNLDLPTITFDIDAFTPEQSKLVDFVVPVKDLRSLYLSWPMPTVHPHYRLKPANILSHLIGHEGEGSILCHLKELGWATGLSAGVSQSFSQFSVFSVQIDLSEAGVHHYEEISQIVFQYIALMREASSQQWQRLYEEVRDMNQMNFRFKSKEKPFNYVSSLAGYIQLYDSQDVLTGPWLHRDYDEAVLRHFLSFLTADNVRLSVISPTFQGQTDLVEPWYSTQYKTQPLSQELYQKLSQPGSLDALHLPRPNDFIPTDFTIFGTAEEKKDEFPSLLLDTPGCRCWYKLDRSFLKPKVNIICDFVTPVSHFSPKHEVTTSLFVQVLQDSLNEYTYDAEMAGLTYSLETSSIGLRLILGGYNNKMSVLAEKILDRMAHPVLNADRFSLLKEQYIRQMHNYEQEQPYQHAMYHQQVALESNRFHRLEKLAAIQGVELCELKEHHAALLRDCYLECLVHGNMTSEHAQAFTDLVLRTLQCRPLPRALHPEKRLVKLPQGKVYLYQSPVLNPMDPNSSVCVYWQLGQDTVEMRAVLDVFAHLASEWCFNQLRTIEQLGYLVWSGVQEDSLYNVIGYRVIVQSSEKAANYLDSRVEAFIQSVQGLLDELSEELYQQNLEAVIAQKLEKDKTLNKETQRHWSRIGNRRYDFDRDLQIVEVLRRTTKQDVINFYRQYIAAGSPQRARFTSQIFGKDQALPTTEGEEAMQTEAQPVIRIEDYAKFRRSMSLFPSCF